MIQTMNLCRSLAIVNLTSLMRFHEIFAFSAVENAIYELRDLTIFFSLRVLNGIIGLRKESRHGGKIHYLLNRYLPIHYHEVRLYF